MELLANYWTLVSEAVKITSLNTKIWTWRRPEKYINAVSLIWIISWEGCWLGWSQKVIKSPAILLKLANTDFWDIQHRSIFRYLKCASQSWEIKLKNYLGHVLIYKKYLYLIDCLICLTKKKKLLFYMISHNVLLIKKK